MYGIYCSLNALNATGNVVHDINGNANSPGVTMTGILVLAPAAAQPTTVSQNTVHSLSNTVTGGSAGSVYGMDLTLPSLGNLIEQNLVHSLNVTSTLTAVPDLGLGDGRAGDSHVPKQYGATGPGRSWQFHHHRFLNYWHPGYCRRYRELLLQQRLYRRHGYCVSLQHVRLLQRCREQHAQLRGQHFL